MPFSTKTLKSLKAAFKTGKSTTRDGFNIMPQEGDSATLYVTSDAGSECSTLVDFALSDEELSNNDDDEYELAIADQAWTSHRERPRLPTTRLSTNNATHGRQSSSQETLLEEEDCSWIMPRSKHNRLSFSHGSRFTMFSKRSKRTSTTPGLDPVLLDPEERSWM